VAKQTTISSQEIDSLLKSLLVVARATNHTLEKHAVEEAVEEPLSSSKIQILRLLSQRGTQTSSQVARFLDVSRPAVTQIIDSMVRSDFVSRTNATKDRREVKLRLTARGKQCYKSMHLKQRHLLRSALRLGGTTKPSRWTEMLEQIAGSLANADRAFKKHCLQCGAHADSSCVLVGGDACCDFIEAQSKERKTKKPAKKKTAKTKTTKKKRAVSR
jgi:DNA-binding MarR family transcriptional regulator